MKKRFIMLLGCALLSAGVIAGCGRADTGSDAGDDSGEVTISSDWELVEFTVNGETTKASDMYSSIRKIAPGFACDDGETCVFSLNGKDHHGTVTTTNGEVVIDFDDTDQDLTGTIDGDTLTLTNNRGTVNFVFESK